jgi:hypothetical protein
MTDEPKTALTHAELLAKLASNPRFREKKTGGAIAFIGGVRPPSKPAEPPDDPPPGAPPAS